MPVRLTSLTIALMVLAPMTACTLMGTNSMGDGQVSDASEMPAGAAPTSMKDIAVVDPQEVALVDRLVAHRTAYHRGLLELRDFYADHGYDAKRKWAQFELAGVEDIKAYRYIKDHEIVANQLGARKRVPEADRLYDRALDDLQAGGHGLAVPRDGARLKNAYEGFVEVVQRYPSSDKVDDAAFHCGLILEEYTEFFPGSEELAVDWYLRADRWDPASQHPALFRAAGIYDYRLHLPDEALPLYQKVVQRGSGNRSNLRWAQNRVTELGGTIPVTHKVEPVKNTASPPPSFGSPIKSMRSASTQSGN